MNDLRDTLDAIKRDAGLTDPKQIELVARVAVDFTQLQARAAAGENVDKEIAVVAATALNLSEHVRNVMSQQLSKWLTGLLVRVLVTA